MTNRIEDYALLSDTESAALVGRDGSIDWLTFPRFDSGACFANLLGDPENGRWLIAPAGEVERVERSYADNSLVLTTRFTTAQGEVEVIDCMPVRSDSRLDVVRLVRGISGSVAMRMDLVVRFDYGSIVPWTRAIDGGVRFVAGPDALNLICDVEVVANAGTTTAEFTVTAGEEVGFDLAWRPSHTAQPEPIDVSEAIGSTLDWWATWLASCQTIGSYRDVVRQSLAVLKGLTYGPTGGIIAAPTTSLPESIGGHRNWDYRYCWLRDATFTLTSLLDAGYTTEATAWRDWLLRSVAGRAADAQIMYGPAGERRLPEGELAWLPGFEGSGPVRIGNGA
ncbi:MAG: glycoside hydrolase family 15 protein, partial [Acidimicrobiales bacterium]|nr:glycoside hydrolase family 15 protein [Acidimicrobiales bacterium]